MPKTWSLPDRSLDLTSYEALVPWVNETLSHNGILLPPDLKPLTRLIARMLIARGIRADEAPAFFEHQDTGADPFQLKGMPEVVGRLQRAIADQEAIAVYGDYDVDGVTATALMVTTLKALGANVTAYIPHRIDDGYGLNNESLSELKRRGFTVVISVDCGVRADKEAEHARNIGIDLLITDHHTVPTKLPNAHVINPKQPGCAYPFKELSGVGIAYKVAQALLADQPSALMAESLLDFVALGTVADVVPLRGENRFLAYRGLKLLNEARRIGIRELILKAGIHLGQVSSSSIGYALGPRLNAAGRLEHALSAYELLVCQERTEAERLAAKLDRVNRERQDRTKECVTRARAKVLSEDSHAALIFAAAPDFPQGIVGLVAGRLAEEFYRPALVIEQGPELSKGSARTIPEFDLIQALDQVADVMEKHGGHSAAAGFTVKTTRLAELRSRLDTIAHRQFDGQALVPTIHCDSEIVFQLLDKPLLYLLEQMQPFGATNPQPTFVARWVQVRAQRATGKDNEHLKLSLYQNRVTREGIAFRQSKAWHQSLPQLIDIAFEFEWNEYNGMRSMQMNIKDIQPSAQRPA